MAKDDPRVLGQLRELFRAELEDQMGAMHRELQALNEPHASDDVKRHAVYELYRATHSLKGAAAAVGYAQPERICHSLEDTLAAFKTGDSSLDTQAITTSVRTTIAALAQWLTSTAGAAPSDAHSPSSLPERSSTLPPPLGKDVGERPSQQGSVRIGLAQLDDVLVTTNEWLTRMHDSVPDRPLSVALEALEAAVNDGERSDAELSREQLRRLVLNLKHEYGAYQLRHRRWEESLAVRGAQLARQIRGLRLQPVAQLCDALDRAASELARTESKSVNFVFEDRGAEADYQVIERLREPLLQLVRNAVVHGIEPPEQRELQGKPPSGTLRVDVTAHGTELAIVVADDGGGIRLDALKRAAEERGLSVPERLSEADILDLMCARGLSTHQKVDHQAGRGIGMDLVKDRVERLQGSLRLSSTAGQGTRIELRVAVDLSLLEVLLVIAAGELFAFPSGAVKHLRRCRTDEIVLLEGRTFVRDGDRMLPVSDLAEIFDAKRQAASNEGHHACVILKAPGIEAALLVDELVSVGEYVVKPLNDRARVPLARAAVMLSEGRLATLLNVQPLCAQASLSSVRLAPEFDLASSARPRVLVVDDSVTTRQLVRIILESANYIVESEADGEQAWLRLRDGERFDALITDIEMPGMSGLDLLTKVRASARLKELPVILITALVTDQERRRALDLGADAYVVKSRFDQQALLDSLEELVG